MLTMQVFFLFVIRKDETHFSSSCMKNGIRKDPHKYVSYQRIELIQDKNRRCLMSLRVYKQRKAYKIIQMTQSQKLEISKFAKTSIQWR